MSLLTAAIGCGDDSGRRLATATPTGATAVPATPTSVASLPPASPTATASTASSPTAQPSETPSLVSPTATACECTSPTSVPPALTPTAPPPTVPPVPTPTPFGPAITYFGLARADDVVLTPTETDESGRPVFTVLYGQDVAIVLEARPVYSSLLAIAYNPNGGPSGLDLLVSRPLGNGSPAVCDIAPPMIGGVPGTDPPVFSNAPAVIDAIDDLVCRVNDGTGAPLGRTSQSACTRVPPEDDYAFINSASALQYCLPIAKAWGFNVGDTIVAARVRDTAGAVSATSEIVVRVTAEMPFMCETGLGERDLTVARPASRLLTSASGSADASTDPWTADPLRICAGDDLGDGVHALALRDDVSLALPLLDGGVLCAKIFARGSSGTLDCAAGTAADVRVAQDDQAQTPIVVDSGLGLDAGTGAAILFAPIGIHALPAGAVPADCQTADFPATFTGALTTATGTAQILTTAGTVVADVAAPGIAFDCANWRTGGLGALVLPFPLAAPTGGDEIAALIELSD